MDRVNPIRIQPEYKHLDPIRIQRFGSYNLLYQPLPRGTTWLLNHERLRFSQNCQLSHTLIPIVSSFYHPISTWSTQKVNFFYISLILSWSWLILRFSDLWNPYLTSIYLFGASNYMKLIFYLINTQNYIYLKHN